MLVWTSKALMPAVISADALFHSWVHERGPLHVTPGAYGFSFHNSRYQNSAYVLQIVAYLLLRDDFPMRVINEPFPGLHMHAKLYSVLPFVLGLYGLMRWVNWDEFAVAASSSGW